MSTTASDAALVHSMGQNGFKFLSTAGTTTYSTSRMIAIQTIADTTITCVSIRGDSLTSVAILAGTVIVGEFSSVTVAGTGGRALVYLASR